MLRKWEMVVDTCREQGKNPSSGPRFFWTRWGAENAAKNMNRTYQRIYGGIPQLDYYGITYRARRRFDV
jgi:hypothetical protein